MKEIVLCNYTSSKNRGCDAIVKSTADALHRHGLYCVLGVHNKQYDEKFGFSEFDRIEYYTELWNKPVQRIISAVLEKVFKDTYKSNAVRQQRIWNALKTGIALNVGGDTYCYGRHMASLTLNEYCARNNIQSVFWGFSIDEKAMADPVILDDLKKYTMLFPRESLSTQLLLNAGISEKRIFQMADPAFTLKAQKVKLPSQMKDHQTVAINISPAVTLNAQNKELLYENYTTLIEKILHESDMRVALLPHVYAENDFSQEDLLEADRIKGYFKNNDRVFIMSDFYTSRELKYIISQCRFLFTARTHASIAGYSSGIPTIVIGYSIKARGIALDLFGTYENYVVECQRFTSRNDLANSYDFLLKNENSIKEILRQKKAELSNKVEEACEMIRSLAEQK